MRTSRRGFTLIELLVVMAIIATLLTVALPRYFSALAGSREAALLQTLGTTRDAIDKFHADTGRYPDDLATLVERHYLRKAPFDPVADSATSWVLVAPPEGEKGNIYDLHSAAPGKARDGTEFAQW